MSDPTQAITVANDATVSAMIKAARRRLVVLSPAVSSAVADAIVDRWRQLGADAVSVILDVDAEVYRLGYGTPEALGKLEETASQLGAMLARQPGIRIGLVIADDETMVFAPTPLLIEAGPKQPETPNAIRLNSAPKEVARELGHGERGVIDQKVGLDKAKKTDIAEVETNLKQNPPQKFDIARSIRVFNAAFEFVDFELHGTFIDRKTVPIPKHLSGVADKKTRDQLRTSFRILPPDHKLSGAHLEKDRNLIGKKYLRSVKNFGNVVLRSRKDAFEKDVKELRDAVSQFGSKVRDELQKEMDKNRDALVRSMLPLVRKTTPKEWLTSSGVKPDKETLKQFLDQDLRRAFGTADKLIKHMEVRLVFKGVTFELLTDEKFRDAAREAIPELNKLYEEFDAAKSVREDDE